MQPLTLPPPPDQDAAALRFASHRSSSAHQPHPHDQYHHQHLRQQQEQQQQQHQQPQYASLQYDHAHNHNTTVVNPLSYRHQQTLPPSIPVGMPAGGILVLPQTQYLPTMMISAESSYRVAATSAGTGTGASTTRRRQAQVANSSGRSSIPNHAQLAPSSMPLGQSNISTSSSCSTRSAFNSVQAPPAFPFSVGNGHRNELSNALAYYNTVFNTFPTSPFPSSFFPATSPNANSAGTSAEGFLGTLGNPGSVPSPISSSSVPSTASSASTVSSSDLPLMTPDVVSPGFPLTTRSDLISPGARPYWTHLESENPSEQQQRKRVLQKAQTRKLPSPQQPQHHHRPPQEQSNPLSSSVLISPGHRNSRGELYGESPDYGAAAIGSPMVVEPTFVEDSASPGIETASCPLVENTESFRRPSNVPQLLHPIVTSAQPSARGLPHAYIEKFPMLAPTDQVYLSDLPAQIHAQRRRTQSAVPLGLYRDSGNSPMCLPTSMSADGVDWISNPQRQQMGSIPTARGLMPSISQQPGAIGETPPGSVQSSSSSPRSPSTCSIDLVASSSQAPHRSPLVDDGDRPATSHSPVLSPARRSGQGSVVIMREGRPPFTNPKSAASSPLTPADYHPPALKMLNVDRQWRLADTSDPPESGANRDRLETVPLRHQTALVEDSGLNPPRRKSSSSSAGATGSTGSILPISGFGRKQRVRCKTAPGVTPALSDSDLALSGPPSPCDGRSNHAVRLAMANVTAAAAGGGGAVPPASPLRTHADRRKSAASPFQNQPHAPTFSTTDFLSLKVEEQQMMALESTLGGGWFVPSSPAVAIMPTFGDCQQVFSSGGWFPMPPDALVSSSTTLVDPHLTSVSSATAAFVFPPSLHEMQQMVPEYDFAAEAVLSTHPSAIMPPPKSPGAESESEEESGNNSCQPVSRRRDSLHVSLITDVAAIELDERVASNGSRYSLPKFGLRRKTSHTDSSTDSEGADYSDSDYSENEDEQIVEAFSDLEYKTDEERQEDSDKDSGAPIAKLKKEPSRQGEKRTSEIGRKNNGAKCGSEIAISSGEPGRRLSVGGSRLWGSRPKKELTESGVTRYCCEWEGCGKTFSTSGHLARHGRIHRNIKPFECDFPGCSSRFARNDNLRQHRKTHETGRRGSLL